MASSLSVGFGGVARAAPAACPTPRRSHVTRCAEHEHEERSVAKASPRVTRRVLFSGAALLASTIDSLTKQSMAFERPPPGYRPFNDTIDGYKLFRPDDWIEVKGSGNDVFFRNPASAEENLFVSISSPSSTKFGTPRDLGTPDEAAKKVLEQTLTEFMSTRIGVRRESSVMSAVERIGTDVNGDEMIFYDVQFRIASYATKNQYGLTEADRPQVLEWDRVLCSTLAVANRRLYELRTQCAFEDFERSTDVRRVVRESFKPFEVDQSNLSFPLF